MKAEEMIQWIHNPEQAGDVLPKLTNLLEEYPYFQSAHLLYLKHLHAMRDTAFPSELKKTACYVGDRKKLYFIIEGQQFSFLKDNLSEAKDSYEKLDSSFSLIDFFLSEKKGKVPTSQNKSEKEYTALISTDYLGYKLSEERNAISNAENMPHQELIDRFLDVEAKKPMKINFKETDVEHIPQEPEWLEESEFFSETLAKIYLKQKKYEKALEIIRKLHLVNPEKNIYFADQIRFLEKLIINIKKR